MPSTLVAYHRAYRTVHSARRYLATSHLTTRSSPISALRSVRRVRAPSRSSSRCTDATPGVSEGQRRRGVLAPVGRRGRRGRAHRPPARPPVRRARQRHRPGRRRDAARRPARHRHHADEPRARGRPARARRVGRAGRAQPRPHARGVAPRPALRARSVVAAGVHDRRQRRAPTPAGRTASPSGVTSAHVLAVDVVLADGETRPARRPRARRARLRPPGLLRRLGGDDGHRHPRSRCASRPTRPRVATMLCAFDSIDAAAATVSGHDRGRRAARRARDDGRAHHAGGRGLRRRGLPARRAGGAARRGRRARRRRRRAGRRGRGRSRREHGAAQRARRGRRRRAGAALEGPQVGVRRDRPHRARLLPARRGRAAHAARRGAARASTRSPTRTS